MDNPTMQPTMTATYSPDDNKLRLYAAGRLPRETYDRVKAAGFAWAPKQELFVAPAWTPDREDLLVELCGEIDDEDTSLIDRAEDRADRFGDYADRRQAEADGASKASDHLAYVMNGQPILIGHHSEKRHRRDITRMDDLTRRAVKLWQTSSYWTDRAAGAIQHAKYKELPAVRARRIKGLEADRRKMTRRKEDAIKIIAAWTTPDKELTHARAVGIANYLDHTYRSFPLAEFPRELPHSQYEGPTSLWSALTDLTVGFISATQARDLSVPSHERIIAWCDRWIAHIDNRLAYERAMLAEAGGIATDKVGPEKGGACRCWASPGHGRGWSYIRKVNKVSVTVEDNWGNGGANFTRTIPFDKLAALMTAADVQAARESGRLVDDAFGTGFFLAN